MIHKTRGIILQSFEYNDNSRIVKIYTESFGLRSYLARGIRNKKGKTRSSVFQPLAVVEVIGYHNEKTSLHKINEIRIAQPYSSIPFDVMKSSIALFLNEVINKSLKEEEPDPGIFEFLLNAFQILDLKTKDIANFHLVFMIQFSRYLGFFPQGVYHPSTPFFDLQEGCFVPIRPAHSQYLVPPLSASLGTIIDLSFEETDSYSIPYTTRKELLEKLVNYYQLHLSFKESINSHIVLSEVLD